MFLSAAWLSESDNARLNRWTRTATKDRQSKENVEWAAEMVVAKYDWYVYIHTQNLKLNRPCRDDLYKLWFLGIFS